MEKIHHCKFSLFVFEDFKITNSISGKPLLFIDSFDNLEEAKIAQKEFKQKTIILPSY